MTFETTFNVPAQLIINGKAIDVMVKTVTERVEEDPIVHEQRYRDSNADLFVVPHIIGKNVQTITTFECIKIENERRSLFGWGRIYEK